MQIERSVYRMDTGELTGVVISVGDDQLERNTPPGCKLIDGVFSPRTHRVDVSTGKAVVKDNPEVEDVAATINDQYSRAEMARLELRSLRALREAVLDLLPDGPAKDRLKQTNDQIINELRPKLKRDNP